jgi:hypothetical protein
MGIFKLLKKGMAVSNKKFKVVIYLWAVNVLFALMVVLPFYFVLKNHISHSLMGESLLRGFDYLWLGDAVYKFGGSASLIPFWFMVPAVFYLFLHIFLNGGIIGRLSDIDTRVCLTGFLGDCGTYFVRFLRLFLLSIPVYLLVVGVLFVIIYTVLGIFTENAATEWPVIITGNLKVAVFVLLFSIVNMFFDYVKIRLVKANSKKVLKETWFILNFILKRFLKAWGLYLSIGFLHIVAGLVYLEVSNLLPGGSTLFLIFAVFLWQQAYMITRTWIKVTFFSSQMGFYDSVDKVTEETPESGAAETAEPMKTVEPVEPVTAMESADGVESMGSVDTAETTEPGIEETWE